MSWDTLGIYCGKRVYFLSSLVLRDRGADQSVGALCPPSHLPGASVLDRGACEPVGAMWLCPKHWMS